MKMYSSTKVNHTPGPWKRRKGTSIIAGPRGEADVCIIVGAMAGGEFTTNKPAGNAQVIEAVPDMLYALELWHERFDDTYDGGRPLSHEESALLQAYLKAIGQ